MNAYAKEIQKVDLRGQMDIKGIVLVAATVVVAFVVITVLDSVVQGIGAMPSSLNTSYNEVLDKIGLLLKITVFGLIMYVVWTLFLRG